MLFLRQVHTLSNLIELFMLAQTSFFTAAVTNCYATRHNSLPKKDILDQVRVVELGKDDDHTCPGTQA